MERKGKEGRKMEKKGKGARYQVVVSTHKITSKRRQHANTLNIEP
jgi:hypothetical protein